MRLAEIEERMENRKRAETEEEKKEEEEQNKKNKDEQVKKEEKRREREREEERAKLRQIEKEKRDLKAAQKQAAAEKEAALNQDLVSKETISPLNQTDNSPAEKTILEQGVQKVEENIISSCEQSSKTTTAAADTSSEVSKKIKETFMKEVSKIIVKVLDPFRKADATRSRIQTIEDFKHLAKKVILI